MMQRVISALVDAIGDFEAKVPAPVEVPFREGFVFRYEEQSLEQAIFLKALRQTSLLKAAWILSEAGQVHEQGILQRCLDESVDDVMFLAGPLLGKGHTERHDQYLEFFWQEEFEENGTQPPRGMVRREKIRAYNARAYHEHDVSTAVQMSRALQKAYSGFVHGSAVHILDLFDGERFHLLGAHGTSRHDEHLDDFENYVFRAISSTAIAAAAIKAQATFNRLKVVADEYSQATGKG